MVGSAAANNEREMIKSRLIAAFLCLRFINVINSLLIKIAMGWGKWSFKRYIGAWSN